MVTYWQDNFDRADSTNSLGVADSGGTYTTGAFTWGINSGQAYTSVSATRATATFAAAVDVDISFQVAATSNTAVSGVCLRWVDGSNFWIAGPYNGTWQVQRFINGGASAAMLLSAIPGGYSAADTCRVVAVGPWIHLLVNGIHYGAIEDVHYSIATPTCGLYMQTQTVGRLDNLLVQSPTGVPGDGQLAAVPAQLPAASSMVPSYPITSFAYLGHDSHDADLGAS